MTVAWKLPSRQSPSHPWCVGAYEITGKTRCVSRANTNKPIPDGSSHDASRAVQRFTHTGRPSRFPVNNQVGKFLVNEQRPSFRGVRLPQFWPGATRLRVTSLTMGPAGGLIAYANERAVRAGSVGDDSLALTEFPWPSWRH
jgi:hypothetical protein